MGYDLAREEYEKQIKRIVHGAAYDIRALEKHEAEFEAEKEKLETEKIKKGSNVRG